MELKKFNQITENDVVQFEAKIGFRLQEDYRDFLLNCNGGTPIERYSTFWVQELEKEIPLDVLYGIDLKEGLNILDWCCEYQEELQEKMIIIGHAIESGIILLVNQDDWKGIYFWDHCLDYEPSTEEECIYKITETFSEFLNKLKSEED